MTKRRQMQRDSRVGKIFTVGYSEGGGCYSKEQYSSIKLVWNDGRCLRERCASCAQDAFKLGSYGVDYSIGQELLPDTCKFNSNCKNLVHGLTSILMSVALCESNMRSSLTLCVRGERIDALKPH